MTRIVCAGIATADLVLTVDVLPSGEGKLLADSLRECGGGVAANAAATAAALGAEVSFVGVVGDDATGERIVAGLRDRGIDTRVQRIAGVPSPVSVVLVDRSGARLVVNHTDPQLFPPGLPPVGELVDEADAVLVDCRWPAATLALVAAARDAGVPSIVDVDRPSPEVILHVLAGATHAVFSAHALAATVGVADPVAGLEQLRQRTDALVAVTVGAAGTWWNTRDEVHHTPAPAVEAVDTTGAGDVFHGALAVAVAAGRPTGDAMRYASAAAAAMCTTTGGSAGIPGPDAVERLLSGTGA